MTHIDDSKDYIRYAYDVINGKIVTGQYIKKACQRFLDWFSRDDIYFDYEAIEIRFKMIGKMRHYQGEWAGKPFILMGWESWCLANIWGWKWSDSHNNVINKVLITMARKNAKTALCAAICLCHVIFDERGAECYLLANSAQQASIALNHVLHFAKSLDPKQKVFQRFRNAIRVPKTDSIISVQSADATTKDGFGASLFIVDEFGASSSWALYNVFQSSQGARANPLAITISTAGFLLSGYPMYDYVKSCKSILDGTAEDDTQFAALYMFDCDDDWHDESIWIKANPSLGETVSMQFLRKQVKTAELQPGTEVSTKTKNFNMFCSSSSVWLTDDLITKISQRIDIKDFKDKDCVIYAGADLASVSDLTAMSYMIQFEGNYYFWTQYFLPHDTIENSPNTSLYRNWVSQGYLIETSGNVTDYDRVVDEVCKVNDIVPIAKIDVDKYNATQFSISLSNEGFNVEYYSQGLASFNIPTKSFERLAKSGKVIIEQNPITQWCFQNVSLRTDHNDNVKPEKGGSLSEKIDGVISMLQCLGGMLMENNMDGEVLFLN